MLAKDGYVAMNREAEDRWRWSQRTSCQKPAAQQNTRCKFADNNKLIGTVGNTEDRDLLQYDL